MELIVISEHQPDQRYPRSIPFYAFYGFAILPLSPFVLASVPKGHLLSCNKRKPQAYQISGANFDINWYSERDAHEIIEASQVTLFIGKKSMFSIFYHSS